MVNAEKYDDQLKTPRKIAQYISTHFGLSKEGLARDIAPQVLKSLPPKARKRDFVSIS